MSNLKSRHAFGSEANIASAIEQKLVDAYDILFLDEGKIGWIDKDGNVIIPDNEILEQVDDKIDKAVLDTVATANAYTDKKVELAEKVKYEITSKPVGTIVNYGEKEIRVMCPSDTEWVKQNVGETGNANMYYMGFKAYAPENAVSFKEGDHGVIVDKMFTFDDDFAGTDEFGRNYSIVWLALASYDESSNTWSYYGEKSTVNKYIGWDYVVEWYDAEGIMIASDGIRINLSNEECHSSIEPYYMNNAINAANAYTDAKVAEVSGVTIVEF